MNEKKTTILDDPQGAVTAAKSFLARLWRIILRDIGMNAARWNVNMERFLRDPANKIPDTNVARANKRGNLNKDLSSDDLTWRSFEENIRWLNPKRSEFIVRLTWDNGVTTEHSLTMMRPDEIDRLIQEQMEQQRVNAAQSGDGRV